MNDPFEVLGLGMGADEVAIRQRYLELVRQFPPEKEPQKFAEIRAAYDSVRDPVKSMERRLFDERIDLAFTDILRRARTDLPVQRVPTSVLLSLGEK